MTVSASIFNGRIRGAVDAIKLALELLERFKSIDMTVVDNIIQHGKALYDLIAQLVRGIGQTQPPRERVGALCVQCVTLARDLRDRFGASDFPWDRVTEIAKAVREFIARILDFIREVQGDPVTFALSAEQTDALAASVAECLLADEADERSAGIVAPKGAIGGLLALLPIVLEIIRMFFPGSSPEPAELAPATS